MIKTIVEKEFKDIFGSPKFLYTFIVCAVLILISFYSGAMNYKINQAHWEAAKAENLRSFEGVTEWWRVRDTRIFLPPQVLSSLVSGISNDIGRTSLIRPSGEVTPADSRFNEEPALAYFRFMDLEFIFKIVLALFAILLGYDSISGEKERGTLKLCLSNAIPRSKYLIGKFVGSFSLLAISLLIALGVGCLMLPILGLHLSGEEWIRLLLIIVTGLLYFGVFLSLAIMVSAMTQRTSSSFLILLIIWIGATLIIPRAAVLLAGRAVIVPTVDEIGYQKAAFSTVLWKEYIAALNNFQIPETENMEETMGIFNNFMDSLGTAREEKMNEYRDRLNETRYNREKERSKVALLLSRLSPTSSLSLAISTLAGVSQKLKNDFYDQSKAYQKTFNSFLSEKTGMNMGGGMILISTDSEGKEVEPIDATEIPEFKFEREPLKVSIASAVTDLSLLLFFNMLFFIGSFISFNRYDAR